MRTHFAVSVLMVGSLAAVIGMVVVTIGGVEHSFSGGANGSVDDGTCGDVRACTCPELVLRLCWDSYTPVGTTAGTGARRSALPLSLSRPGQSPLRAQTP